MEMFLVIYSLKIIYRASHYIKTLCDTTEMGFNSFPPTGTFAWIPYKTQLTFTYLTAGNPLQNKYVKQKFSSLSILLEYL